MCVQLLPSLLDSLFSVLRVEYGPLEQVPIQADILLPLLTLTAILVTNSDEKAFFAAIAIIVQSHSLIILFSFTAIAHLHTLPFILFTIFSDISKSLFHFHFIRLFMLLSLCPAFLAHLIGISYYFAF